MEADGLLTRERHQANRRIHVVRLTDTGEVAFVRLADAAVAFDQELRRGFTDRELVALGDLLDRLAQNVGGASGGLPWAGLAEDRE
jgi:MarR family transcriptional regulator, transcriptional regulator for hemolysin